VQETRS